MNLHLELYLHANFQFPVAIIRLDYIQKVNALAEKHRPQNVPWPGRADSGTP